MTPQAVLSQKSCLDEQWNRFKSDDRLQVSGEHESGKAEMPATQVLFEPRKTSIFHLGTNWVYCVSFEAQGTSTQTSVKNDPAEGGRATLIMSQCATGGGFPVKGVHDTNHIPGLYFNNCDCRSMVVATWESAASNARVEHKHSPCKRTRFPKVTRC